MKLEMCWHPLAGFLFWDCRTKLYWPERGKAGLVTMYKSRGWLQGLCFKLLNTNFAVKVINIRDYIGLKVVQLVLVRMVTRRIADGFMTGIGNLSFFLSFQCWNFRTIDGGYRNRVGIGLLYRSARLHRLAESIPGIDSWAPYIFTNLGSV
jgi:hypothetical protein